MKKVIFVLALSGLVSTGSFATALLTDNTCKTEISKDGDKKKKKSSKKECCSSDKAGDKKCCEGKKKDESKKDESSK